MRSKFILPSVLHLDFDTTVLMSKALGRVQEYAENPRLKGQRFSWSRLKAYARNMGYRHYFKSSLGFNIPGDAFAPFLDGSFGRLSASEQKALSLLRPLIKDGPFYVIATADGSAAKARDEALLHEMAHAMWFTNPSYREKALSITSHLDQHDLLIQKLSRWHIYHESVLEDELHAYLGTDPHPVFLGRFDLVPTDQLAQAHKELNELLLATLPPE